MKKINYARAVRALVYRFAWPRNQKCVLCGRTFYRFLPYQGTALDAQALMQAVGGVGSDLENFECPWCGCHDRERHLFLYMTAVGLFPSMSGMRVLHFAPEKRLSPLILGARPDSYTKCDLFPQTADVMQVDILDTPFEDCTFDLVIANHVMEHVADDLEALREVFRVLKPEGYAILQTPFSSKLYRTWSDPGIDTDRARLQAYGQEDHVRLYGRDITERFESVGLASKVKRHIDLLVEVDANEVGVNEAEPFFLFQKL